MALSMMAASTQAFSMAPALATRSAPATVTMGFESELGATGPLGLWDPLGLVRGPPLHPPRQRACLPVKSTRAPDCRPPCANRRRPSPRNSPAGARLKSSTAALRWQLRQVRSAVCAVLGPRKTACSVCARARWVGGPLRSILQQSGAGEAADRRSSCCRSDPCSVGRCVATAALFHRC